VSLLCPVWRFTVRTAYLSEWIMNRFQVIFLSLLFAGVLAACSEGSSEDEYISKAHNFLNKHDYKSASIELKNALKLNADNGLARLLLGEVSLKSGDFALAEKELQRALELGVGNDIVLPALSKALFALGKRGEVLSLSDEGLTAESRATVLASKALVRMTQDALDDALSIAESALMADVNSAYAKLSKARILIAKQDAGGAKELVKGVLKADDRDVLAWGLLASIEALEKRPDAAIAALSKAIEYQARNWEDRRKRALLYIQRQELDKAQADVSALLSAYPKSPYVKFLQGLVYFYADNFSDAANAFNQASTYPDNIEQTLFYLTVSHYRLGNIQQAEEYAVQLNTAAPDHAFGAKLLAGIKLDLGQYDESLKAIQSVLKTSPDDVEALNILARIYVRLGDNKKAMDLLFKIVELEPDSEHASTNLGVSLLLAGQQELGLAHLQTAIKLNPKVERADLTQVMYFIKVGEYGRALTAAESYRQRNPDSAEPHNLIGLTYLRQKKVTEASRSFQTADEIEPGNARAGLSLASIAIEEKNYPQARSLLKRVLKTNAGHYPALMKLVSLDMLEKNYDLLVEHLQETIRNNKDEIAPRLVLAKYYLSRKQHDLVLNAFTEKMLNDGNVLALRLQAQLALQTYSAARLTSDMLVKAVPNSPQTYFLESQVYAGLKEYKLSNDSIIKSLDMDPGFHPARIVLARQYLLMGKTGKARKHIRVLSKRLPNNADVMRLVVAQHQVFEEPEKVLAAAKALFEAHPDRGNMNILSRAYLAMDDKEGSAKLLTKWVSDHTSDVPSLIRIANQHIELGQLEPAKAYLDRVIELNPKNLAALNNLAWYLRKIEPAEALDYAERAYEIAPDSVRVMDTYSLVLLENRRLDKAVRIAEKALGKNREDPVLKYHVAMIQSAAGNDEKAIELLRSAVEFGESYPELEDAKQLLKKLTSK